MVKKKYNYNINKGIKKNEYIYIFILFSSLFFMPFFLTCNNIKKYIKICT